jgi:hypothetical protein
MAMVVEEQIPPLMNQAFQQLAGERARVLEDVNRQRTETQAFVRGERQQVVEAITNERTTVLDTMESMVVQQRIEALKEIDRQRSETINTIREERLETIREMDRLADEVVDSIYSRVWLVLVAIWVGVAALIVLARWLFRGRKAA